MKKLILLIVGCIVATQTSAQTIISIKSDVRGKSVTGEWKAGSVTLVDGTEKSGQTRGFTYSGDAVQSFKFRAAKGEKAEVYKADNTKYVQWGGVIIVSLPKNFKKPGKGNRFYTALYYGKNISVLFDPKARTAGIVGFNSGEKLNVLVLKNNTITKVSKLNFRKMMTTLCNDSEEWKKQAANKKWFKYRNMYEVASFYDDHK